MMQLQKMMQKLIACKKGTYLLSMCRFSNFIFPFIKITEEDFRILLTPLQPLSLTPGTKFRFPRVPPLVFLPFQKSAHIYGISTLPTPASRRSHHQPTRPNFFHNVFRYFARPKPEFTFADQMGTNLAFWWTHNKLILSKLWAAKWNPTRKAVI